MQVKKTPGGWRASRDGVEKLLECDRDDYNWGFQLYRTVYSPACSDADFERAVETLHEYMRWGCFYEVDNGYVQNYTGEWNEPEQLLWKHLKNNVVQDKDLLDGASVPRIQELAKDWIQQRGADMSEAPRYRFFIIMDDEVVRTLLRFPSPASRTGEWQFYSVKVLDVEYDAEHDKGPGHPGGTEYHGWFWAAAWHLEDLAFTDIERDGATVYSFDPQSRPVHMGSATGMSWFS